MAHTDKPSAHAPAAPTACGKCATCAVKKSAVQSAPAGAGPEPETVATGVATATANLVQDAAPTLAAAAAAAEPGASIWGVSVIVPTTGVQKTNSAVPAVHATSPKALWDAAYATQEKPCKHNVAGEMEAIKHAIVNADGPQTALVLKNCMGDRLVAIVREARHVYREQGYGFRVLRDDDNSVDPHDVFKTPTLMITRTTDAALTDAKIDIEDAMLIEYPHKIDSNHGRFLNNEMNFTLSVWSIVVCFVFMIAGLLNQRPPTCGVLLCMMVVVFVPFFAGMVHTETGKNAVRRAVQDQSPALRKWAAKTLARNGL